MPPSERNEGPTVVMVVDRFSKSPLFFGSGQFVNSTEEVGGNEIAIKEAREGPANDNIVVEGFKEEQ